MTRPIVLDFFDRPLAPEHFHDGFCFLDSSDRQHGPRFPNLVSAVAWLCEQDDGMAVKIGLVPESVLAHER
jgi:hypothetical protein